MKNNELAEEIHEVCHEACLECPQFMSLDDDSLVEVEGSRVRFDSIPKRGIAATIRFWRDDATLWEYGYEEYLPHHIKDIFDNVDRIVDEAIVNYVNGLGFQREVDLETLRQGEIVDTLFRFIDRMLDPSDDDPLEQSASEFLKQVEPLLSQHVETINQKDET